MYFGSILQNIVVKPEYLRIGYIDGVVLYGIGFFLDNEKDRYSLVTFSTLKIANL